MGKLTAISDDWWDEIANIKMHPFAKAIYFYLKTGHRSISGIFKRSIEEIAFKTGVSDDDAYSLLTSNAVKGITYNSKLSIAYVHDKFASSLKAGGTPELIAVSVLNDYYATSEGRDLWLHWRDSNGVFIAESAVLTEHFALLERVQIIAPRVNGRRSTTTKRNASDDELDTDIQRLLCRYTRELDETSSDVVLRVYERICFEATKKARISFLKSLSRFELDAIVAQCAEWSTDAYRQRFPSRSAFISELSRPQKLTAREEDRQ